MHAGCGARWPRADLHQIAELVHNPQATAAAGVQNLLCAYLAAAVLAGLLANTLLGWWWLDPAIGLGIAAWAI